MPKGRELRLGFNEFSLETSSECHADRLELFDGYPPPTVAEDGETKPYGPYTGSTELLARYCGDAWPQTVYFEGRYLTLVFVSDFTLAERGFEIEFSFI